MQYDFITFYTFTGALSLAALYVLSQKEGLGLPGGDEGATLIFCSSLTTAVWSCMGVLYGLGTEYPADDDDYIHLHAQPKVPRITMGAHELDVFNHDDENNDRQIKRSKSSSPSGSVSSGKTTEPDESDSDSELDVPSKP